MFYDVVQCGTGKKKLSHIGTYEHTLQHENSELVPGEGERGVEVLQRIRQPTTAVAICSGAPRLSRWGVKSSDGMGWVYRGVYICAYV